MKRFMAISLVVTAIVLISAAVYAHWDGYGMGYGAGTNVGTMTKFQKETLSLRDELTTKNLELQNEYAKSVTDTGRIVTLKKEIIDLEANIQGIADKYNMPSGVYMGGRTGYGMGHGYGMMGRGCGCGW